MSFDFAAAEKEALKSVKPSALIAAVVLGPTRAGKSYLFGTLPGKILFLYTTGEDHGKDSAKLAGGNVVSVPIDLEYDKETKKYKNLTPDQAYKRLLEIVRDGEGMAKQGINSIALDGLTEIEQLIRSTTAWIMGCRAKSGEHNGFAEPGETLKMMRPIMDGLRTLQREYGLHYATSCLLMVKEKGDDGEILASEPKLVGYEVAAQLIPQFPDQILLGRMINPKGAEAHRLQFGAMATKTVKEKNGEIKKQTGFQPCLRGVPNDALPNSMRADLGDVVALKQKCIDAIGKPKAKDKKTEDEEGAADEG